MRDIKVVRRFNVIQLLLISPVLLNQTLWMLFIMPFRELYFIITFRPRAELDFA